MIIDFDKALTKEFILSHVSEEEIFAAFGVPVQDGVFRSNLRNDRHPTCNFYRRKDGRLILRDHAGYFWGDCFDLVMRNPGVTFGKALEIIAVRFSLTDSSVLSERIPAPRIQVSNSYQSCNIRIKRREWNSWDRAYWNRWHFREETLALYHISPVERVWINDEPIYAYRKVGKDEAYVYHFGQYDYKVYFPHRTESRFRHNNSWLLQGYLQLPASGEMVVITKSLKDVAKMYEFGIPAVAPMSETTPLSRAHMEELSERFARILLFYDNDMAGMRQTIKMLSLYGREFGLEPLLMPRGMPKDFTDYYQKKGKESTTALIEHVATELNLTFQNK